MEIYALKSLGFSKVISPSEMKIDALRHREGLSLARLKDLLCKKIKGVFNYKYVYSYCAGIDFRR